MRFDNLFSPAWWSRNRQRVMPELKRRTAQGLSRVSGDRLHFGENARRIEKLRGRHRGRRAVIIGNGPSLKVEDLTRLQGEITFAANKIFLAFDRTPWRPTYYNVEDPLVIQQNYEKINSLGGFPKLLARHANGYWVQDEWTILYDLMVLPEDRFPEFSPSPHQGLNCGFSVCISSLQWAWFMGITEIYLIGVDFSFTVPKADPAGMIRSEGEVNHFLPGYRAPGEKWQIPNLDLQERAFAQARDWLAARGVKVFNATRGGKLEVFPRVDFDRVF